MPLRSSRTLSPGGPLGYVLHACERHGGLFSRLRKVQQFVCGFRVPGSIGQGADVLFGGQLVSVSILLIFDGTHPRSAAIPR